MATFVALWRGRPAQVFMPVVGGQCALFSRFLNGWDELRDFDANHSTFARPAPDVELKTRSIENPQALAHVAQANSFHVNVRQLFLGNPHAVVLNLDAEAAVAADRPQFDFAAAEFRRESMLQTIF